jgi:hypothetical protein
MNDSFLIDVIVDQHRTKRTTELRRVEECDTDPDAVLVMISSDNLALIEQECADLRIKGERDGWEAIA